MNAIKLPSSDSKSAAAPQVDVDKPPILVVDDSIVSQRLAGGLIQHGLGHPVIYANDGIEAVSLLELVEPCVLLTDIHMPHMDGFELVETIRTNYPQIPVILMTAHGSETIAMRALAAGAANYVPKDCLVTDLVETLRQILVVVEGNKRRRRLLACQTARAGTFMMDNDPDLFPDLIALVQEELLSFSIGDETTRMRFAIALHESLTNALYHGNLECSSQLRQEDERHFYGLADERRVIEPYRSRRIHVKTRIDRDEVRVDIRDQGPGFDVASLDKPYDPGALMHVGGRGMILIRTFLDEVIHNEVGNQITLIKRK